MGYYKNSLKNPKLSTVFSSNKNDLQQDEKCILDQRAYHKDKN